MPDGNSAQFKKLRPAQARGHSPRRLERSAASDKRSKEDSDIRSSWLVCRTAFRPCSRCGPSRRSRPRPADAPLGAKTGWRAGVPLTGADAPRAESLDPWGRPRAPRVAGRNQYNRRGDYRPPYRHPGQSSRAIALPRVARRPRSEPGPFAASSLQEPIADLDARSLSNYAGRAQAPVRAR